MNVQPGFTLMRDVRDAPALPNELRAAVVTWLPEMSAGVAVDVLCAVFYPVSRRSGARRAGRLLFGNFAGNRRALQAAASWNRKSIYRSSFTPGPAAGTLGRRQLSSPSWRFFVVGLFCLSLTDPPGDSPGCGSWQSWKTNALT